MHVLHFNILNGFNNSASSIHAFGQYLGQNNIDILMLNEYRFDTGLDNKLHSLGYTYSAINSNYGSPNRSAIFSRIELDCIALPDAFRMVWVRVKEIDFVAYHASPGGVDSVLTEVEGVVGIIRRASRAIVCGDLNSLSRHDFQNLQYEQLNGLETVGRYSKHGTLDFAALQMFEQEGFEDKREAGSQFTVPTERIREHEGGVHLRLDYVLARNASVSEVKVLRDAPFNFLSDHFPILFSVAQG